MRKHETSRASTKVHKQVFPRGWNERRVKSVIAYYDRQTPAEELAEYEAAIKMDGQSMMIVPSRLVSEIQSLIQRRRGA